MHASVMRSIKMTCC